VILNLHLLILRRFYVRSLQAHRCGAAGVDNNTLRVVTVARKHGFGSNLSNLVHFHVCEVDGVFG
jgi:hypothetical protein